MDKKTITLNHGETLAYVERGDVKNPVLLLLHGNMSAGSHFEPVFEGFEKHFRIIAPDLRGFGDSTYHTPIESLDDFAEDVRQLMDELHIYDAHVAGWSTGGGVAMSLAADHPERVKTLVLIESAPHTGYPVFKKDENMQPVIGDIYKTKDEMAQDPVQVKPIADALERGDEAFMRMLWQNGIFNVSTPDEGMFTRFIAETMKQRNLVDVDWALMTFNISDAYNGLVEGDGRIKNITMPVLAFHGEKDLVIPRGLFDALVATLKHVEPVIWENGSHAPLVDDPQRFIDTVTAFLLKN